MRMYQKLLGLGLAVTVVAGCATRRPAGGTYLYHRNGYNVDCIFSKIVYSAIVAEELLACTPAVRKL